MYKIIKTKALTKEAFSKFGDVIEANEQVDHFSINDGFTTRYNDLAKINTESKKGRTLVSIFRSTPMTQPIKIEKMERHPLSSQSFVPLGNEPFLVVVAPQGEFDEESIEIFLASSDQGVNYHAGTWHHFSLALNTISDFLVIDRGGENDKLSDAENNCDEVELKTHIQIENVTEFESQRPDEKIE